MQGLGLLAAGFRLSGVEGSAVGEQLVEVSLFSLVCNLVNHHGDFVPHQGCQPVLGPVGTVGGSVVLQSVQEVEQGVYPVLPVKDPQGGWVELDGLGNLGYAAAG